MGLTAIVKGCHKNIDLDKSIFSKVCNSCLQREPFKFIFNELTNLIFSLSFSNSLLKLFRPVGLGRLNYGLESDVLVGTMNVSYAEDRPA